MVTIFRNVVVDRWCLPVIWQRYHNIIAGRFQFEARIMGTGSQHHLTQERE